MNWLHVALFVAGCIVALPMVIINHRMSKRHKKMIAEWETEFQAKHPQE